METSRKRIRRDYAPLNVAVSLVCTTPGSPSTQVYNSENQQFEADRSLTPCVLSPVVVAHAKDGSWPEPSANKLLSEMKWFINGKDITTLNDWKDEYSIDNTPGSSRGSIAIKKNILPGTVYSLQFKGVIADTRTGTNIPIFSDEIILSTSDKSEDSYSLSIGDSQIIRYDPFKDKLSLYEYKVAHGLINASSEAEKAAKADVNGYLCHIPLTVFKGTNLLNNGYKVKLFEAVEEVNGLKEVLSSSNHEIVSITPAEIIVDLRLIKKKDFVIRILVGEKQVAQEQFSVNRMYPRFRCSPTNGTGISPNDTERYDVAMVDTDGHIVECPESVLKIVWKTDTESKKGVIHNEGGVTLFQLAKTGIGTTFRDDWLDVYTESEYKDVYSVATDESGNILTDESNNPLIFN